MGKRFFRHGELHLVLLALLSRRPMHGYDLMKDVPKGGSVSFSFKGSIEGRFVVELEDHKQQIAELDVTP